MWYIPWKNMENLCVLTLQLGNYSSIIIVIITPLSYISYSSPLLFVVSLSAVWVTRFGQPRSENSEWKVPEINDS